MADPNALLRPDLAPVGGPANQLAPQPSWADAADWHAQNAADTWTAAQQPQTWLDAAQQYGNALLMGTTAPGFRAFHGSPHDFDAFDTAKIGIGQGAQTFGHGLYFADNEAVAQSYRDSLARSDYTTTTGARIPDWIGTSINQVADQFGADSKLHAETIDRHLADFQGRLANEQEAMKTAPDPWNSQDRIANFNNIISGLQELKSGDATLQPRGRMYEVNINANPEHMLDYDKPLSEQSQYVQDAYLGALEKKAGRPIDPETFGRTGEGMLALAAAWNKHDPAATSQMLRDAGIAGIRYLDQGSRSGGTGTSNTVVFDPATVEILRKYGIGGLIAGGGAAAGVTQGQQ